MQSTPLKKSQEMPHYTYVFPQTKKILARTVKIRGTLVFLCPKERERERERERKREREIEQEQERERKRERERDRTKVRAIKFLSRPGKKNPQKYTFTVQERAI